MAVLCLLRRPSGQQDTSHATQAMGCNMVHRAQLMAPKGAEHISRQQSATMVHSPNLALSRLTPTHVTPPPDCSCGGMRSKQPSRSNKLCISAPWSMTAQHQITTHAHVHASGAACGMVSLQVLGALQAGLRHCKGTANTPLKVALWPWHLVQHEPPQHTHFSARKMGWNQNTFHSYSWPQCLIMAAASPGPHYCHCKGTMVQATPRNTATGHDCIAAGIYSPRLLEARAVEVQLRSRTSLRPTCLTDGMHTALLLAAGFAPVGGCQATFLAASCYNPCWASYCCRVAALSKPSCSCA